jgi:hypothetical protein
MIATVHYSVPTGAKPVAEYYGPERASRRLIAGSFEERPVHIADARPLAATLSLELNGFVLVRQASAVGDFFDRGQVESCYYPELERLVRNVSGAVRAIVFNHTLRSADAAAHESSHTHPPVGYAHTDYTEEYAPRRLREVLAGLPPGEAAGLLRKRFAIIQVWRALSTVRSEALALVDARTVSPADLIASEVRLPERVVENYQLAYNPEHRWLYFPVMQPGEAIVFKTFDSATDGRARFTPHVSFTDPSSPADAPPRKSIEARMFAFFDETA